MSTSTLSWEPPSAHLSELITATVERFVADLDGLIDEMALAAITAAPRWPMMPRSKKAFGR
ncbi:hypothetical protein ACIBG0_40960 [Nocardia sp. NPDC050630]|uniref:hypothetical protein n=1 Tax=Nocardia sp. NPDC050630 TaxID=3364321 RepID=UPI0037A6CDF6